MNILGIPLARIVLITISFLIIINQLIRFYKKEKGQTYFKLISTLFIWISILLISALPNIASFVSSKLGFGDNLNTLIFIGFIVVFLLVFKLLDIIERLERNITEIVRKQALKEIKHR